MFASLMVLFALAGDPPQEAAAPRLWTGDEVTFLARPQPEFPTRARSSRGEARLICTVTARGAFSDCQIETETPKGNGFGSAAMAAMHRGARIEMSADGPTEGDRVDVSIAFSNGR
ncbi:hypothetical protein [Brevundimonas sp.]|uniref:hypothetical protein n=1 Tax=Brevundimonas sp. TaxID=1871086 RepID=UPI002D784B1E|nr:hypothetical protein [Brevundimonas sp.]